MEPVGGAVGEEHAGGERDGPDGGVGEAGGGDGAAAARVLLDLDERHGGEPEQEADAGRLEEVVGGAGGEVDEVLEADGADDQDREDEAVEGGGAAAELGGEDEDEQGGVGRAGLSREAVAKFRDRGWVETCPDPTDGRKTLAEVTKAVKLEGDRRRARTADDALDLVLANAEPAERQRLAGALERLHELLVRDPAGEVRTLRSERPAG
jgi:hypothetical protein